MNTWLQFKAYLSPEFKGPQEDTEAVIIPLDRVIKIKCDPETWVIYLDVKSDPNLISRVWLPAVEGHRLMEQLEIWGRNIQLVRTS